MSNGVAGLSVSWELDQEVYGSIEYHVTSDQNLTCNATSGSCTLPAVSCGDAHTIQVTASNEAGPSYPSIPVVFITCEWSRLDSNLIHTVISAIIAFYLFFYTDFDFSTTVRTLIRLTQHL